MFLRQVDYDHPDAARLIAEVQQMYVERYGGEDDTPVEVAQFAPPKGLFLVGYLDGEPIATGGWRAYDGSEPDLDLTVGDVELKRMYVVPWARGRGYASILLQELENTARAAGHRRMVLETGDKQPEAIALYLARGYSDVRKFGMRKDSPTSVHLGKMLAGPEGCTEDAWRFTRSVT